MNYKNRKMKLLLPISDLLLFWLLVALCYTNSGKSYGENLIEQSNAKSETESKLSVKGTSFDGLSPANAFKHLNFIYSNPDLADPNNAEKFGFLVILDANSDSSKTPLRLDDKKYSRTELIDVICDKFKLSYLLSESIYVVSPLSEPNLKKSFNSDQLNTLNPEFQSILLAQMEATSITASEMVSYLNERLEGHKSRFRIRLKDSDNDNVFSVHLKSIKLVKLLNVIAEVCGFQVTISGDLILLSKKTP